MTDYIVSDSQVLSEIPFTLVTAYSDTLTVTATGFLVQAIPLKSAVFLNLGTKLTNSGKILSADTAVTVFETNTIVENLSGGLIYGRYYGVVSHRGGDIINSVGAAISGGSAGIQINPLAASETRITNNGTISGAVAVNVDESASINGAYFTLINNGKLESTVSGPGAYAVRISKMSYSTLTNSGEIDGAVHLFGIASVTFTNSGIVHKEVFLNVTGSGTKGATYNGIGSGVVEATIYGSAKNDSFSGGNRADKFEAGGGDDVLKGGDGNDTMNGQGGRDVIQGGRGADVLVGGALDTDLFVFETKFDSKKGYGIDLISDFTRGIDDIDLRPLVGKGKFLGSKAFTDTGHFEVRVVKNKAINGQTVLIDLNGDGATDMAIQISGRAALSAGDFLL